jgi:hypothetical protein
MKNELTKEEIELMDVVRDEWINKLSLPLNRGEATEAIKELYKDSGLNEPKVIFVDSPMAVQMACNMITGDKVDQVLAQVSDQVLAQVENQVGGQVENQVSIQVRAQVWDQIRDQVWDQISDQVGNQVRAQVWNLWNQVGDQVGNQVLAQVWDQVLAQVSDQVLAQVRDQVGGQVENQVRDQVENQVRAQVWDQVLAQVSDQVRAQVWDQDDVEFFDFSYYGNCSDYGWCSFYDFFTRIGVIDFHPFNKYLKLLNSGVYDMVQLDGLAIVCGMPSYINRDESNRLHKDGGYAIEWPDGYGLHFLHGTSVPEYLAITPAEDLDLVKVLAEANVDVRLEGMRKVGIEKVALQGKLIDSYENYDKDENYWYHASEYKLYDLNPMQDGLGKWLSMKHQTINQYCVEGVGDTCNTIKECLDYRNEEDMSLFETINIK